MKKIKIVIRFVVSAVLVLSIFTACSGKHNEPEQLPPSNPTENVPKIDEQILKEENTITLTEAGEVENAYIYEKYHYEGERIAQSEMQEYKFRLPQLKSTSSEAEEINRKIISKYEGLIKEQIACAVDPDMFYDNIYWQSYINNGLLSIVIVDDNFAHDYKDYSVYLFDTNTEKTVSNSAVLAAAGISKNDFISRAKEIAKELFSEIDFGTTDDADKIKKERLDYMLSKDNISINTPMFIDDVGTLNAIIEIGQAGGADYKYEIIKINREQKYTLKEGIKLETKHITEKYSYSGKFRPYDDKSQPEENYVLRLPEIKSSSDSAKDINKRIVDKYDEMIKKSIESFESECNLYTKVNWESYLYNDIISIVITTSDYFSESYRDYSVYNFNVKTEKEVTNSEILKLTGLSESEFIKKSKSAAEEKFRSTEIYNSGIADFYEECLKKTVSDENITSSLPMFLDDNGVLNTIVVLYQVGGGETNNIILQVK